MNDKELPVKFANAVISELALVHAHSEALSFFVIRDIAQRNNIDFKSLQDEYDTLVKKKAEKYSAYYSKTLGI